MKLLSGRILLFLAAWGFGLALLSLRSQYSITRSVGDVNFEIATMLTPAGIVRNLMLSEDHYLKPYYHQLPQARDFLFNDPLASFLYAAFAGFSVWGLCRLRKARVNRG